MQGGRQAPVCHTPRRLCMTPAPGPPIYQMYRKFFTALEIPQAAATPRHLCHLRQHQAQPPESGQRRRARQHQAQPLQVDPGRLQRGQPWHAGLRPRPVRLHETRGAAAAGVHRPTERHAQRAGRDLPGLLQTAPSRWRRRRAEPRRVAHHGRQLARRHLDGLGAHQLPARWDGRRPGPRHRDRRSPPSSRPALSPVLLYADMAARKCCSGTSA